MSKLDIQARMLRVVSFTNPVLADLATDVQDWFQAGGTKVVQTINYQAFDDGLGGNKYTVFITYTEA